MTIEAVQFLHSVPDSSLLYVGSYHFSLIALSILIAIVAAYAAMRVSVQIALPHSPWIKFSWIAIGAITMGLGTWAMHFIGMLSLQLPCGVYYDPVLTLLSMLPGIVASGLAIAMVSRPKVGRATLLLGSLLLGSGIGAMHYAGMAAMRLNGFVRYDAGLFVLSVVVAVLLAYLALRVKVSNKSTSFGATLMVAVIMGGAVSGMHYTAMLAAYFVRGNVGDLPESALGSNNLALIITVVTTVLAMLALALAAIARNREMTRELLESEQRWSFALEGGRDGVWDLNVKTGEVQLSKTGKQMFGFDESEILHNLMVWQELVHPDDRSRFKEEMFEFLHGTGKYFSSEYRVLCKDNDWKWIHTRGMVVRRDMFGKALRMIGTHTDVTERKLAEQALRSSEERFRSIFENSKVGINVLDANFRFLQANQSFIEMTGYTEEELQQRRFSEITHPDDAEINIRQASSLLSGEIDHFDAEKRYIRKDGSVLWAGVTVSAERDDDGKLVCFIAIIQDISERKRAEEELELAAMVYKNSSEAMMVTDSRGAIVSINPAFVDLTGYTLENVIGKTTTLLSSGRHDRAFYQSMWDEIRNSGHWQGEIWNRRKNGELFLEWLTINTIFNEDGSVYRYVSLFSDITKKKETEELVWKQANFDTLTGLPNRRMLYDRLKQEIKKSHRSGLPMALMLLDIDHFKEVNDTLGHAQGDVLLIEAARRITECVRESDTVARLGGDEFTVILSEVDDINSVERIAQNIIEQLAAPFQLQNETAFVSASLGITLYPDDALDIDALIKNADQAMYLSKKSGRNRFSYFTAALQEAAQTRMRLSNDLRSALAGGQLMVYYQPILEMTSSKIIKAEALLRWNHPERGFVSPAQFIPLAEESGMIHEIGDWVFREAMNQVKHWRENYVDSFQISVNKSPVQFRQTGSNGGEVWLGYLRDMGLPGQSLVIEITEGLLLNAEDNVTEKLLAFGDAGVQLAIDDFGTGYSSLAYLKKFDIDYLKIDQSFVRNLESDPNDMALCEAIIVMAHKLGLKVIAEGVETEQQHTLLMSSGCDYAQGFLYSAAIQPQEFELLLQRSQQMDHLVRAQGLLP